MSAVRLVHGKGLVGRTDSALWWTADDGLLGALSELSSPGFMSLADAILGLDFEIDGVAAVDLATGVAFVSGAAVLVSGGSMLDGSTTGTWIEQQLVDASNFAVNAYVATIDEQTNLIAGIVRGGGFVFGEPELFESPPESTVGSGSVIIEATVEEPVAIEATAEEPVAEVDNVQEDAEKPCVDEAEPVQPQEAAKTIVVPPPAALPLEEDELEEDTAVDPEEASVPIVATVEFDDGRQMEIEVGLIVGRNPTSVKPPAGFDSVTVLGEFVSRRHWQLDVRNMVAVLTDLGSASGTIVESDGTTKLGPDEQVQLASRSRVLFADHWATVRVKAK